MHIVGIHTVGIQAQNTHIHINIHINMHIYTHICAYTYIHYMHYIHTHLLISTSAFGTTDSTKDLPSARIRANNGATTDVFPAPMIICFTYAVRTLCQF
jgi:hypothetical protein